MRFGFEILDELAMQAFLPINVPEFTLLDFDVQSKVSS
jgi:hypothetical protein